MGRIKDQDREHPAKKRRSLQRQWLRNTLIVVLTVGLLCVAIVTVAYGFYHYKTVEWAMKDRAESVASFFSDPETMGYESYWDQCARYAQSYEDRDGVVLQFIDTQGNLVSSSDDVTFGKAPDTPEIQLAIAHRDIRTFSGLDSGTGKRVLAVSCPMIYSNGEVAGVLRFVASAETLNRQIVLGTFGAFGVLVVVALVALIAGNYYIRSILASLNQITEKAQRIAAGAYGVQLKIGNDDEIGDLAKNINEMSAKIAQNEKMQTEFISSLSHELRTPLTAINGWSETLLSDESLAPDTKRGIRIISREAKRLTEMVVELLDFTRIQDGRMTLNVELTDIRGEFEDTVFMYSSRLSQDGIMLDYLDNDDEIPEIMCDPQRLKQVFLNILDNGAKHGGDGKRIEASVNWESPWVVFRIRDFGPGIPEDEIPLVKRKFYKGSSKARGSGIGLAVCDEIVQLHGGELILTNAEGGGTEVTVRLPVAQ